MKALHWTALILVVIGALNWGLVGFFQWNLVTAILGPGGWARLIYALVGLAGLVILFTSPALYGHERTGVPAAQSR